MYHSLGSEDTIQIPLLVRKLIWCFFSVIIEGFVCPQNANGIFMDLNDKNRLYECINGQPSLVKTMDCTVAFTLNPIENSYHCEGKTFFHRFWIRIIDIL